MILFEKLTERNKEARREVATAKLESRGGVRGEVNFSPELWGQGEAARENL